MDGPAEDNTAAHPEDGGRAAGRAVPPAGAAGAESPGTPPPATGNRGVDELLAGCAGLSAVPVGERLDRISAAQRGLEEILQHSRDGGLAAGPRPGGQGQT